MSKRTRYPRKDAADKYAADVLQGKIAAGPGIRGACARHFRDLKRVGGKDFPYVWNASLGDRAQGFFESQLKLSVGETDGQPFVLLPWQAFYLRSIFAWVHKDTGLRRFRTVYLETSKSSGKSQLNAGIGMYMLVADGERQPQVYIYARDKNQAKVLFLFAVEMVNKNPKLSEMVEVYGGNNPTNMTYKNPDTGNWGFFRREATQTEAKGASGPIPSCALIDEIHELQSDAIIESMRKGAKTRKQPLLLLSTNAGESQMSVGWDYHEMGLKVASGDADDDSHFALVYGGDVDDDPIEDESVWVKSNPSMPLLPGLDYLRAEVAVAKQMNSKRNLTLRLNFGEWIESSAAWIESSLWEACEKESLDAALLRDNSAVVAFDLSARRDLTAGVVVWRGAEGRLYARAQFWLPEEGILVREREDRVPYTVWRDKGVLTLTPGGIVDYDWPVRWLIDIFDNHDVRGVAFDRWKADEFLRILRERDVDAYSADDGRRVLRSGIGVYMHGQGTWRGKGKKKPGGEMLENGLLETLFMPSSIDYLEEAIVKQTLDVEMNPCLRWNVTSAVTVADPSGNRRFDKRRAVERIDGVVALAMAVGLARAMPLERQQRAQLVHAL